MVKKPKLGTKRVCPSCATKYYDLERNPIICPNCGTKFELTSAKAPVAKVAAKPPPEPVKEPVPKETPDAPETVSLEEADAETTETGAVDVDLGDDESDDDDLGKEDDNTFLVTDDDSDDDVGDIIGEVKKDDP